MSRMTLLKKDKESDKISAGVSNKLKNNLKNNIPAIEKIIEALIKKNQNINDLMSNRKNELYGSNELQQQNNVEVGMS